MLSRSISVALSDTEIAEEFNSYFSNIGKRLASKFANNDHQLSHSEISNSTDGYFRTSTC